ncbi:MAG: hypothetical protein ABIX01_19645 [Chitinophagaceae bacterium]
MQVMAGICVLWCISDDGLSQVLPVTVSKKIAPFNQPGNRNAFIENIGQYGNLLPGHEQMGAIRYGYEALDMPVLFSANGVIYLQRKIVSISHQEKEKLEEQGLSEEEIERKANITDRLITMEWLGANPAAEWTAERQTTDYHTYGLLQGKAFGYQQLLVKNLYPGIDLEFSFPSTAKAGFEYNLLVEPGADIGKVRMKFGGDVKKITTDSKGNLIISTDIGGIQQTVPVSYYGDRVNTKTSEVIHTVFAVDNDEVRFSFPANYDRTKAFVIDPFVTATGNLTGLNSGKAKDVDFDYAGNMYVTGGGDGTTHQLAKYDASGVLEWTFSGTLTIPAWTFGSYWGGWMVEKPTGNVYLGQGFNPATGFQVIRISTTGLYDNFITTANASFREAWKMLWSCNNGLPQILVAGGGTNSNINFGVFTPPATAIGSLNVTGIPYTVSAGWAQDIVDFVIDPSNNDMYTIYGSLIGNPSLTNKIYKNTFPYSGASVSWNVPSGFVSVQEIANRPYLTGGLIDNSANIFAVNASYLYYWDGKNLKAFDKLTGNGVGSPLVTSNTTLMQGGIVADACNNVFVGEANGIIKVYKFNGSIFDDAAAPDISIPGFNGKAVYDLAYDQSKKLVFASGDGFVGSFDVSAYCPTTQYTLNVIPNCLTATANVVVSPTPLAGSIITYILSVGGTQIATNTTGIFPGLNSNITYTVTATINQSCSGTQATTTFIFPGPTIAIVPNNTTCGANTGSINATGSGTNGPYTYSIDGVNFLPGGTFTGLSAGVYTITVKDGNGCASITTVTLQNTNGPTLSYTSTNSDCGNNNGTITANASGGTTPLQYSINGVTFQSNNFFNGLAGGRYTLTVRDATGCINAVMVTLTSSPRPFVTAIPAAATCGSSNGTITAFGSSGTAPLTYSINDNVFQVTNVFTSLTPGNYTVTVKDASGCSNTTIVTLANSPAPTVNAVATAASCNNQNGVITATGVGGIAPLQYSINGVSFQNSNIFTGLTTGAYTVTVKDNTGCSNTFSIAVPAIGGPSASAVSTVSACNVNDGSITITGSAGTPGYQYSINGIFFQAGTVFNGLAAGNYVAYVKDANGCIGTTIITVANTAGPTLSVLSTPTACGSNTGTITANGSGGAGGLQYSIDGSSYSTTNVFTGLATGIYRVYVKDGNGCIKQASVTIVNTSGLSLAVNSISSSCITNNGIITATATGGANPLQYSINGVIYQLGNIFNGLSAASYTVYVKDAGGCVVTRQATIGSVTGPAVTLIVQQNATCGAASGVIRATATGGVAPLTYNIDGGVFQSISIFINVPAGLHTIIVKDAGGCTASQTVTITNATTGTAITDVTFTIRDILGCTGGTGRIKNLKGVPSGGGNHYTFSLDGGAFTTANQFTNVVAGTHTITAMNDDGCMVTRLATLGVGTPATATGTATPSACGSATGSITIVGVGPNTPYHASINGGTSWITFFPPGANTITFNSLAPGTYPIIIADDADFTAGSPDIPGTCLTTIYVAVPSTGGPSMTTSQVNASCTAANGSITINATGGVLPYTYNINGGGYFISNVFNNLLPGPYAVTVKDNNGCITGVNIVLLNSAVPTVTAAVRATSCNLSNGTITATATGGIAPLQYSIDGTTFQNSNFFNNLAPGSYTLYVKDVNGCYASVLVPVVNTPLPKVTAFTVPATCNNADGGLVATGTGGEVPYTFSINGTLYQSSGTFNTLLGGFYTVYIKDGRGCITTTGVSVANISTISIVSTVQQAAFCGNATGTILVNASGGSGTLEYSVDGVVFQLGNSFTALLPGNYTVTVRDATGCLATKPVVVSNLNGPQVLTATILDASCGQNNGAITANASGGTGSLKYSIDGTNYQLGIVFSSLSAGGYTLYVKDFNGCIKSLAVTIANLPAPALTLAAYAASCGLGDGTITAQATGGTGVLAYSKDGTTFQSGNIFLGLAAGPYTITVKDTKGCTTLANINVGVIGATITPTFNAIGPICSGAVLSPLPTTSLNGVTGTWLPALNNTTTTLYTFTPTTGQCATTTTLTITVNPKPNPILIYHN